MLYTETREIYQKVDKRIVNVICAISVLKYVMKMERANIYIMQKTIEKYELYGNKYVLFSTSVFLKMLG